MAETKKTEPKAYYIDEPAKAVSVPELNKLGVFHYFLDADNYEQEGKLAQICQARGYTYKDFVDSRKIPNLKEKLANFFEEHIHDDEEIRFFVDGSGYFDVRSLDDRWIRIELAKGEMIILPAGIYHRFNPDEKMFFSVMRLFVGDPVWTPFNRSATGTDERVSRAGFLQKLDKIKQDAPMDQVWK
eukprot:TRINITY_DN1490_c0_g1_i2.p2 TRINITY_DN1490_c0_g1~~TRINITY_DN1490_c0_g1_i2.p2  ORF type:complete len:186 (+),score=59.14 TRINITY_DN1490_c0_g1_i2:104-661(+)